MLGNPQIKGALPEPNKMMTGLAIISVVIITVVVGGTHLAAQEVGMTPMADSAPRQTKEEFQCWGSH